MQELNIGNKWRNKQLQKYCRSLCLHIDDVPRGKDESSDDAIDFTKSSF